MTLMWNTRQRKCWPPTQHPSGIIQNHNQLEGGEIHWTYPGMWLFQARSTPVHARVCSMQTNKIQPQTISKTATSTISTLGPKLQQENTICKTSQKCPAPWSTTNKIHPRGDWNSMLHTSGPKHNVNGTKCNSNGTSSANNKNDEKYQTVSELYHHKQWRDNHIPCTQHGLDSA